MFTILQAASGTGSCTSCGAGKYLASTGSQSSADCTACPSGKFSTTELASQVECTGCAAGKYGGTTGLTTCTSCPDRSTSSGNGGFRSCKCAAGYTGPDGSGPACDSIMIHSMKSMLGQYLYELTMTNGAGEDSTVGGLGGDPFGPQYVVGNDYITGIKFWPFIATWASYLGCGIELYTKNGNTISFLGSYYEDSRYCGAPRTYDADSLSMVVGIAATSTTITGVITTAICSTALCEACAIGTYKSESGSQACTSCQAGSLTQSTGSSSQTACLCSAGFETTNLQCTACLAGKYKGMNDAWCMSCPTGTSSSTTGNTLVSSCVCNAGTSGNGGGPCTPTAAGSWSGSDGVVSTCPENSFSPAGSSSSTACMCNAGFVGANGATCTGCAAGKYKTSPGSVGCLDCPEGSSSPSGSASATTCVLGAGYSGPVGGPYTQCGANTYNSGSSTTCSICPTDSQSPVRSISINECQCNAGFTGSNGGTCSICPAAKYKSTIGSAPCSSSPAGTSCPAGVTSATLCPCDPGTAGPGGGPCSRCDAGKYSADGKVCTSCPSNSISPAGSTSESDCTCNAGYTGSAPACTACPVGAYKTSTGDPASKFKIEALTQSVFSCAPHLKNLYPCVCTEYLMLQERLPASCAHHSIQVHQLGRRERHRH